MDIKAVHFHIDLEQYNAVDSNLILFKLMKTENIKVKYIKDSIYSVTADYVDKESVNKFMEYLDELEVSTV